MGVGADTKQYLLLETEEKGKSRGKQGNAKEKNRKLKILEIRTKNDRFKTAQAPKKKLAS